MVASAEENAATTPQAMQQPEISQVEAVVPQYGPRYGMGMMRGYGPGYGMGMMDGMNRPGYGMGMMGGYGPGYGMMRGGGPGFGAMGFFRVPDLTSEQIDQMQKVRDEWIDKMRPLMREVMRTREKMIDMYESGNRNSAEFGKVFSQLADFQRQAIEARMDTQNRLEALLTKEQKEWLEEMQR